MVAASPLRAHLLRCGLALVVFSLPLLAQTTPPLAIAVADRAMELVVEGNWPAASEAWRQAVQLDPVNADYRYNLGMVLMRRNLPQEAEPAFREAVRLKPGDSQAWSQLGLSLVDLGRYEEAQTAYGEALKLAPQNAAFHGNMAGVLFQMKRYEEAEAAARTSLRLQPNNASNQANLANILLAQRKFTEAEAPLREAIRLRPDSAAYRGNLGAVLFNLGKYDLAEAAFQGAGQLDPNNPLHQSNLGLARIKQSKWPSAETALRRATTLAPQNASYWGHLGQSLLNQDKWADATTALQEATRLKPDSVEYQLNLGRSFVAQNRFEAAVVAFEAVLRLDPENIVARRGVEEFKPAPEPAPVVVPTPIPTPVESEAARVERLGSALWQNRLGTQLVGQNRFEQAAHAFATAVKLVPDNPLYLANQAGALLKNGKRAEAEALVADLAPFEHWALRDLGRTATTPMPSQKDDEAVLRFASAMEANYRGNTLFDRNQFAASAAAFREATTLAPDYARFHANLAGALFRAKQLEAARNSMATARRLGLETHWVFPLLEKVGE